MGLRGISDQRLERAAGGIRAGLRGDGSDVPEVPAIGDAASIQWALGKKLGDTVEMTDERGRPFRLRLVAGVANSVLQGNLVIDEAAFTRLFPGVGGHRWFLIDAPTATAEAVSARLARALEDRGVALTPASARLAEFHAVQNTYLSTFQVWAGSAPAVGQCGSGGGGAAERARAPGRTCAAGCGGLRPGALAATGDAGARALLAFGLGIGVVSAAVAVLPALWAPTTELPLGSLALTLGGVVALGGLTTWLATGSPCAAPSRGLAGRLAGLRRKSNPNLRPAVRLTWRRKFMKPQNQGPDGVGRHRSIPGPSGGWLPC
jgi:putative ABC transport system permease protein